MSTAHRPKSRGLELGLLLLVGAAAALPPAAFGTPSTPAGSGAWRDEFSRPFIGPDWEVHHGSAVVDGTSLVLTDSAEVVYAGAGGFGRGAVELVWSPTTTPESGKALYVGLGHPGGPRVAFDVSGRQICIQGSAQRCWGFGWSARPYRLTITTDAGIASVHVDGRFVGATAAPPGHHLALAVHDDGTTHRVDWISWTEDPSGPPPVFSSSRIGAVSALDVRRTAEREVTLSWAPPTVGPHHVAGYHVFRGPHPDALQRIAATGPASAVYTDDALATGVYYYNVRAVAADGLGPDAGPARRADLTGTPPISARDALDEAAGSLTNVPAARPAPVSAWADEFTRTAAEPEWEITRDTVVLDGTAMILTAPRWYASAAYVGRGGFGDGTVDMLWSPVTTPTTWKALFVTLRFDPDEPSRPTHQVVFDVERGFVSVLVGSGEVGWPHPLTAAPHRLEMTHAEGNITVRVDGTLVGHAPYPAHETANGFALSVADDGTSHRIDRVGWTAHPSAPPATHVSARVGVPEPLVGTRSGQHEVTLTWAPPPGGPQHAALYHVYRGLDPDELHLVASVAPPIHAYLDRNLAQAVYHYEVRAVAPDGVGAPGRFDPISTT